MLISFLQTVYTALYTKWQMVYTWIMNETKFKQLNPWLYSKNFKSAANNLEKRFIYKKILKYLNNRLIVSLEGPRRLGKTTLLQQIIHSLVIKNKDNVFFYEFSETDNNLSSFFEYINNNLNKKCYVLLDEIQHVKNWQSVIKLNYDLYPKLHIVVTGSLSISYKKSKESLLGRIMPLKLDFLSFGEYLYLKYKQNYNKFDFLNPKGTVNVNNVYQNLQNYNEYLQIGDLTKLLDFKSKSVSRDFIEKSVLDFFFTRDSLFSHFLKVLYIKKNEQP